MLLDIYDLGGAKKTKFKKVKIPTNKEEAVDLFQELKRDRKKIMEMFDKNAKRKLNKKKKAKDSKKLENIKK